MAPLKNNIYQDFTLENQIYFKLGIYYRIASIVN